MLYVSFTHCVRICSVVDILRVYKASFSAGSLGELVIPESLHMLPYFVLGMLKSPLLR